MVYPNYMERPAVNQALPLELFEYDLPEDRIAQEPVTPRHESRLLVMDRESGECRHRRFWELPEFLRAGDVLVVNRTRVIPARLVGRRPSGGKVELLLHRPLDGSIEEATEWLALGKPGKALREGARVLVAGGAEISVVGREEEMVRVRSEGPLWPIMTAAGELPLPPYISRPEGNLGSDAENYQSVFAEEPGAVAAPTASLHFTPEVLTSLKTRGVEVVEVVLHVGPGTFLPVRREVAGDVRDHRMHGEQYGISADSLERVRAARERGGRVVAVGTTAVRALETCANTGELRGESTLFIYPGYKFQLVDAMVTNFHLPRSTLLMLVSAFAGRESVLSAYAAAVEQEYRFFSYGDAMLLV